MNGEKMILATASFVLILVFAANRSADAAEPSPRSLAWPGCPDTCGNLTNIPYPFGIGPGCFLDPWYEIDCQQTRGISIPVLKNLSVVVLEIRLPQPSSYLPGLIWVNQPISYPHLNCTTNQQNNAPVDLRGSTFRYSQRANHFVAGGCDIQALMAIDDTPGVFIECNSSCGGNRTLGFDQCQTGIGCCMTSITDYISKYSMEFKTLKGEAIAPGDAECWYAFLVEATWLSQHIWTSLPLDVPVVLEWAINSYEKELLSKQRDWPGNNNSGSCQPYLTPELDFLLCSCNQGYIGNYFLSRGCQGELRMSAFTLYLSLILYPKLGRMIRKLRNLWKENQMMNAPKLVNEAQCLNRPGSYNCLDNEFIIVIGVAAGVIGIKLLLLLSWWFFKFIKRRREAKLKQKFFKRNGGLVLQQRLSSLEDNHMEKGKLFTSTELDTATDHFNDNRILGQGGQGTIYKGMLIDGTIIAIKKSKVVDAGQVEQFVNEVIILSEINHRNVVKLLGFCLESEVPLLVYEFVSNGTLYQYLHTPCKGRPVSWETRLRIASEVAGALSYLYFAAAIPIYHRDIKSSNILLDENYRAKVADFGASKSITIDQTHLTTKVQGTFGYLDPEYFQTGQFTDKSDVYSFGVVLVELLTGEKPISQQRAEEGRSLAMHFVISMEENRLFDVLDKEVLDHSEKEEIIAVSNLTKRCLNLHRRYRPTMKEVAMELERVRTLRNPVVIEQDDEEIYRIRTGSIRPLGLGAVSTSTQLEAEVELTLLEEDQFFL